MFSVMAAPERHEPSGVQTPWRKSIAVHMNVTAACDFSCRTAWTPLGKQMAYVLTFVHLGSRNAFASPSTLNPTDEWMRQQARNLSMWAEEDSIDIRFLLHDRDTKFTEAFDEHFRGHRLGPVLTPYGAPVANCFAETWIGSLKRECLNMFFCFSLRQLDHIGQTYVLYHNRIRPHQALGNRPVGAAEDPPPQDADTEAGSIRCQHWLRGLLNHYYRRAA
jgi:putative transposase